MFWMVTVVDVLRHQCYCAQLSMLCKSGLQLSSVPYNCPHNLHTWCYTPITFSSVILSLGLTGTHNCLRVSVGLKYTSMPYPLSTLLYPSEKPFIYGMTMVSFVFYVSGVWVLLVWYVGPEASTNVIIILLRVPPSPSCDIRSDQESSWIWFCLSVWAQIIHCFKG